MRWPMRIHGLGDADAATLVFQRGTGLHVAVIVKATFQLVPGGVMTWCPAEPIVVDDVHHEGDPARSVSHASDLVPYRPEVDVTLVGAAHAPSLVPVRSLTVQLTIARDDAVVLDKALRVDGDVGLGRTPGAARPTRSCQPFRRMPLVYERAMGGPEDRRNPLGSSRPNVVCLRDPRAPGCFGPIPATWAVRRDILGAERIEAIGPAHIELPRGLSWAYFQAAPPDQRLDRLEGGERITLRGLQQTRPLLETVLPRARALARMRREAMLGDPFPLRIDSLAIDAEARRASLTWRGRLDLRSLDELDLYTIVVAVETPDRPADWSQLAAAEPTVVVPAGVTLPDQPSSFGAGATQLDAAVDTLPTPVMRALCAEALPFSKGQATIPPPMDLPPLSTGTLDDIVSEVSSAGGVEAPPPNARTDPMPVGAFPPRRDGLAPTVAMAPVRVRSEHDGGDGTGML